MPYSPRNIKITCNHAGLTHYGGVYFFHEFLRVLQLRHFLATHLTYPRRNSRYHLSQMILALMYPIVLGLDRLSPSQHARPPQISRNQCARPSWQNNMAVNWPQLVKPRACRSVWCSFTAFSNSPRENSLSTCEKILHTLYIS